MNIDEQILEMLDKSILIELVNENVIPLFSKENLKAIFLDGLFFY